MRITCETRGHRLPEFLSIGTRVRYVGTACDTGTHRYAVEQRCARCSEYYVVAYVNAPGDGGLPPNLS